MTHDQLVEEVAKALYDAEPLRDQDTDDDGRVAGPAFDIPWEHLGECDKGCRDWNLKLARIALSLIHSRLSEVTPEMVEAHGSVWEWDTQTREMFPPAKVAVDVWCAMLAASPLNGEGK